MTSETIYAAYGNICPLANTTFISQCHQSSYRNSTIMWESKISGTSSVHSTANTVDSDDNIIIVGIYHGDAATKTIMGATANFYNIDDTIGLTINANGNYQAFIAKYNKYGYICWVAKISGISNSAPIKVTTDAFNNIVIIGTYEEKLEIYNSSSELVAVLPPSIGIGTFIAKYDAKGSTLWANIIVSTASIIATDIAIDITNNIIITGYYNGTCVTFYNPDNIIGAFLPISQGNDVFISKYNFNGYIQWTTRMTDFATTSNFVSNISNAVGILNDEKIVVSGWYQASSLSLFNAPNGNVRSDLLLENPNGNTNAFIVLYSKMGIAIWATRIDSVVKSLEANLPLENNKILLAVDNSNDIIITGTYASQITTFYSSSNNSLPLLELVGNGRNSMFISKYDHCGTILWASRISGNSWVDCQSVATDHERNILVAGHYGLGKITIFDPDSFSNVTLTSPNNNSSFVIKYNFLGKILWAAKQTGVDSGLSVKTDMDKNIILTGTYSTLPERRPLVIYDSNGRIVSIFGDTYLSSAFIVKYVDFSQILKLQPALCAYTNKKIYFIGFNGCHTLVVSDPNVLFNSLGKMINGIVLLHRDASIFLIWSQNKWTVVSYYGALMLCDNKVPLLI
jgi:hypothetical protein